MIKEKERKKKNENKRMKGEKRTLPVGFSILQQSLNLYEMEAGVAK